MTQWCIDVVRLIDCETVMTVYLRNVDELGRALTALAKYGDDIYGMNVDEVKFLVFHC